MYMCFLIKIVHNINSLEKCSVEKKIPVFSPDLSQIFLSQDFSRLENLHLIIFLVFKLSQCVREPWEGSLLNIQRAGVTVFSWVDFSPQYILGHKVRETCKTYCFSNCLQSCFLLKVTIGLLWNVLWVVHIISIAHRLELMQAMVILRAVNVQYQSIFT